MAKRKVSKKESVYNILKGQTITIVARKKGQEEKQKDMEYTKALEAKAKFEALGWSVSLYQVGFYQPFNNNNK